MDSVNNFLKTASSAIINPIINLMIAVAVLFFLFGVWEFIAGAGSDDKRETGKKHMVWGVIGLFIMISVWGIMAVLSNFWN